MDVIDATLPGPAEVTCDLGPSDLLRRSWVLYLLECRNGAFYAGITNDLPARYAAHACGKGARYTRANPPLRIVATASFPDRAAASRAEYQLKQLPKRRKLQALRDMGAPCINPS